jgi:hypothetical protein
MYWHSYECDDVECKRGPTGMVLEIRTDWAKEPKGVRCPFCQRKPRYRGHWLADEGGYRQAPKAELTTEDLLAALRNKASKDLNELIREAKVVECWMPANFETVWSVFAVGQPFRPLGHVARQPNGTWVSRLTLGSDTTDLLPKPTRSEAQVQVEQALQRKGYVVHSPANHEVPA